ncbi:DUF6262 family protein [Nocardia fluminea]|uniref:Replication region DNA-binding N-term n=1 Tax=Nocardia fluminea TaxID=134984 RepID=A0A2N3V9M8_9NOCA|nr:DUF6262 family protein [Nocardia fluminea]PKV78321.1 hypothetical protein ATK86_2685 [Nocardia fluminea]
MTAARTPAQVLQEARERGSRDKRSRVLAVVDDMITRNHQITFAGVARAAAVSNWLVYAPGIREHIDQARARQQARPRHDRESGATASPEGLRTDLALARAEIVRLRAERDQLKATVQRQLGQQLDQLHTTDLITRIDELTEQNKTLATALETTKRTNTTLQEQLTETQDDLAAARTSLRRMIKGENRTSP